MPTVPRTIEERSYLATTAGKEELSLANKDCYLSHTDNSFTSDINMIVLQSSTFYQCSVNNF